MLLGDETGDCLRSAPLLKDSFPIKENPKFPEKAKELVVFQKVPGILGPHSTESPSFFNFSTIFGFRSALAF